MGEREKGSRGEGEKESRAATRLSKPNA